MSTLEDEALARLALERGLVALEQLGQARVRQRTLKEEEDIEEDITRALVGIGALTDEEAHDLVLAVEVQGIDGRRSSGRLPVRETRAASVRPAAGQKGAVPVPVTPAPDGAVGLRSQGRIPTLELPAQPPLDRSKFIGPYEIVSKIGAGAMGEVYQARKAGSERLFAVKVLSPERASEEFIARFKREVEVARRLNHANVVRCVEFGYDPWRKVHYYVMHFVDGESVKARVERAGPLSEHEALVTARQVAMALRCAYDNNLVHRDVKPEKVMLTSSGRVKLLDLGLARPTTRAGSEIMFAGSPFYASPERARGETDVDIRSDIYSLGATTYYMVTGVQPFAAGEPPPGTIEAPAGGSTVGQVLAGHMSGHIPWPSEVAPEVSEEASLIIAKAMARDPAERYQTPVEFTLDLDIVLQGIEPVLAKKTPTDSTVARPSGRRRRPKRSARLHTRAPSAAQGGVRPSTRRSKAADRPEKGRAASGPPDVARPPGRAASGPPDVARPPGRVGRASDRARRPESRRAAPQGRVLQERAAQDRQAKERAAGDRAVEEAARAEAPPPGVESRSGEPAVEERGAMSPVTPPEAPAPPPLPAAPIPPEEAERPPHEATAEVTAAAGAVEEEVKEVAEKAKAREAEAKEAEAKEAEAEKVKAEKARAEKINAEKAKAEKAEAEKIRAEKAEVEKARAEKIRVEKVKAEKARAEKIRAEKVKAEKAKAEKARAEKVKAEKAKELKSKKAKAREVRAEKAKAEKIKAEKVKPKKVRAREAKAEVAAIGDSAYEAASRDLKFIEKGPGLFLFGLLLMGGSLLLVAFSIVSTAGERERAGVAPEPGRDGGPGRVHDVVPTTRQHLKVATLRGPSALHANIPPDASVFGGHSYKFYAKVRTWHRAKAFCEDRGGHLVTIGSREEQGFVNRLRRGRPVWIGLTDEGHEGKFEWVSGELVSFARWSAGQPNNYGDGEHCVQMWRLGTWNDTRADVPMSFVCEWDATP